MKIEKFRIEKNGINSRTVATIKWEDNDRPLQDIYFETEESFSSALSCGPEPFLAAALTPALWAGEGRILIQDEVCPEMLSNVRVAARFFQHWFGFEKNTGVIEAKSRPHVRDVLQAKSAALFFSGGLDSLAALRENRLGFSPEHPGWIKDGLLVYGLEVENEEPFRHVKDSLKELAQAADVNLITVSTNIRSLNPDWGFWWKGYMGPALCAIGHALSNRLASVVVACDYEVEHLKHHGSHPVIEPNFSSHDFRVRYDGVTLSRLEKARLVAEWEPALRFLRVCNKPQFYQAGQINCSECEKCIRTMLELLVAGALDRTTAFGCQEISAELILGKSFITESTLLYYEELIAPLEEMGRHDLVEAINVLMARYRGEIGWKGSILKIDRKYLNGGLRAIKHKLSSIAN